MRLAGAGIIGRVAALALAMLPVAVRSEAPDGPLFDVIIRGGTVFDGTGSEGRRADVGIRDGYVVEVGDLARAAAATEIDATGKFVSPGFINVHDHTDAGMHENPVGLLSQGITTAIGNPDGWGETDIFAPLQGRGAPGINYGAYIGFNAVWAAVMGEGDRRPSPSEIAAMRELVLSGMEQGAFGVSAGLDYKPGFFATTQEVTEVVAAAQGWRTNFPNHERLWEGNGDSSLSGMAETIAIASAAGMMPVVTHMKMLAREQGRADEAFAMFRGAAAAGHPVGVDAYPYDYAATALEQILIPAWAQEGGIAAMKRRFADPALRPRIAAEASAIIANRIRGASNVYLPEPGRQLEDYMAEWDVSAGEAVIRLIEAGYADVMLVSATRADLDRIMLDPLTAVSCDCGAITSTTGHPRNWGTYPLFFGRYVRERGLIGWAEAIRKSTGLPATMIGLVDRGFLMPGMVADITIFDPETIIDRANVMAPTMMSQGIVAVLVNGQVAWRDGQLAPGKGRRLVRPEYGISRPFELGNRREIVYADTRVDVRVSQTGMQPAIGRVVLEGDGEEAGRFVLDLPVLLQTGSDWAAVTGIGREDGGRHMPATFVIDRRHRSGPRWWLVVAGETVRSGMAEDGPAKQ